MKPSLYHTFLAALRSFRDINQRMHNKVMLVDDAVLLTEAAILKTLFRHSLGMNFRDGMCGGGSVVHAASQSFETFWTYRHAVASRDLVVSAPRLRKTRIAVPDAGGL